MQVKVVLESLSADNAIVHLVAAVQVIPATTGIAVDTPANMAHRPSLPTRWGFRRGYCTSS